MRCGNGIEARQVDELFINIDPIQAGGRLTADAMKAVVAYGDGYSVCDNCRKPNRLDYISKPPIAEFHKDVAQWLNMDAVRTVPGARRGFQAVAQTYVNKGDPVLLTTLSHYTEFLAIEEAGGVAREIPANEQKLVTPDATAAKIEEVKREFGRPPVLAFIDHVDYQYGNMHDVAGIAKVAHQYDIPVVYNGAYTVGILPVDGKKFGVDFVVGFRPQEHGGPGAVRYPRDHRGAGEGSVPDHRNCRRRDEPEVRDQGTGDDGLHADGRDARRHDGLVPAREGAGKTFRPRTGEPPDRDGGPALYRGNEVPLGIPAEAHDDPGRHHWIVRPGRGIAQETRVLSLQRP